MRAIALSAALGLVGLGACAPGAAHEEAQLQSPQAGEDLCHAAQYQSLVGKNRSEIPAQPAGAVWRVACTACPVTMDHAPMRLNIFYDEASGRIESVRCG